MGLGTFNQSFTGPPTTQGKTHLGIASCNLVKDYVNSYPCLREVSILLKEFLAVHEFNVAYKGGISSYSAVILIVAYMNNFQLQQSPHITPSRLLMGFLDFYSNCFDSQKFGINILNDMSFYPLPSQNQQMFVIVDPVNPQNNTARNSYRTPEILDYFRNSFMRLKAVANCHYVSY
jgi:DNA polymerase sigma